jgi:hypothetical protein
MVVVSKSYRMSGECIGTTLESICGALEGGSWSINRKSDELRLVGAGWRMQLYSTGGNTGTFLLGGTFSGELESVRTVLEAMATRLSERGIVSFLEAGFSGEPDYALKIVHPDYPDF